MFCRLPILWALALSLSPGQQVHVHPAPEQLGEVSFPVSCQPAVQAEFNRAVALLHSFAYKASEDAFRQVAQHDPSCAMAHWGVAMTHFHQLWQPPVAAAAYHDAQSEIEWASKLANPGQREGKFIHAAGLIFADPSEPYEKRALRYEQAMADLAGENNSDAEAQVFHALALLANASPSDKTHARQKKAVDILEPIFRRSPNHPGVAHYLIHACDNGELAQRGLPAARLYAKIAPSAPHALHMPSHLFTRLGLWEDSIASNLAAQQAARRAGDRGEELHAMDYLVYAYLQLGRDSEAAQVVEQLKAMAAPNLEDFKVSYAFTALPVRYVVERRAWAEAAALAAPDGAPPEVAAIVVWARALGQARGQNSTRTHPPPDQLQAMEEQLEKAGSSYWATQVRVLRGEVMAWQAHAARQEDSAATLLRKAADLEDSIEKLPVTPGPIVPAREQLGDLLREQGNYGGAAREYRLTLVNFPGRRGALRGLEDATARARLHSSPSMEDGKTE